MLTLAENRRMIRARDLSPGQHLWVQASGRAWAGPRFVKVDVPRQPGAQVRVWTVNGGHMRFDPWAYVTVVDHPDALGDVHSKV